MNVHTLSILLIKTLDSLFMKSLIEGRILGVDEDLAITEFKTLLRLLTKDDVQTAPLALLS